MAIKKPTPKTDKPKVDKTKEQEKIIDLELKKISLAEKKIAFTNLDANKTKQDAFEDRRIKVNEDSVINSRLFYLTMMLQSITIDSDKTIMGSEPVYKQLFDESEQYAIKAKMFELIKKL